MKSKTSITLSQELLRQINDLTKDSGNRSSFIEKALWKYLESIKKDLRDRKDLQILNRHSARLNKEAKEVLTFQVDL